LKGSIAFSRRVCPAVSRYAGDKRVMWLPSQKNQGCSHEAEESASLYPAEVVAST
jgi:hypothetical protein